MPNFLCLVILSSLVYTKIVSDVNNNITDPNASLMRPSGVYKAAFDRQPSLYIESPFVSENQIEANMVRMIEKAKNRIAFETGDSPVLNDFLSYLRTIIIEYGSDYYNKTHSANVLNSLIRSVDSSNNEIFRIKSFVQNLNPRLNSTAKANELVRLLELIKAPHHGLASQSQTILNAFQFYEDNSRYFLAGQNHEIFDN